MLLAVAAAAGALVLHPARPALARSSRVGAISLSGGKGFGGGEATRDPAPTYVDPSDPKGKQQAIHKAESFAEYLARRDAGGGAAAPAAAAQAAAAPQAAAPMAAEVLTAAEALELAEVEWNYAVATDDEDLARRAWFAKLAAEKRLAAPSAGRSAPDIFFSGVENLSQDPFGWFFGAQSPLYSNVGVEVPSSGKADPTDTDVDYERVPWWKQTENFSEYQRQDRRTIFMHDDWVRHRSSERFLRNFLTIGSSGIVQSLKGELTFVTSAAASVVLANMLFHSYTDFGGVAHPGVLADFKPIALPALPFSITLPALSLLLVFRCNTGYARWNEARTLWGGLINNCRNVVRQANTFFPDTPEGDVLKRRMAAETAAFVKGLRNFLRGPSDDETLRSELGELVAAGLMPEAQAEAMMGASNRPCFALSAMSATLRKADLDPVQSSRIDSTFSILLDLTGANERIFKSPIPLVYTRLTSRFLTIFLTLLPLALWKTLDGSWNHWATIPAELAIAFFLFGIDEVGITTEEPFSILPLEAFCNGAIAATNQEMLGAVKSGAFDEEP